MAKKKSVKKVPKKSKNKKKVIQKRLVRSSKRKINLVVKNLVLFGVLALIFFCLYIFSNNELFRSLFQLLAMILGFVGVAFLIVLLALMILKLMKK